MKILYFINGLNYKGGIARIVVDKANSLAEVYGHEVTICTINGSISSAYPLSDKVSVIHMSQQDRQASGVIGKLKNMVWSIKDLKSTIRRVNPDVIDNAQTQVITWLLPFVARSVPKVMEIHFSRHGMSINIGGGKIFQWLYFKIAEFTYSRYDKFVCLTEEDTAFWPCRNKMAIGNFTNVQCRVSPLREKVIVCTARYHVQKRIDLLIDVWAKIAHNNPEWKVEVYGMGPDKVMLQQKVDEMGLHDSFILNDAVNDVSIVYERSSIFALTSEHEGFCLSLLEAMQAGLPVCAFSIIGINCAVSDGESALLAPFGDVDAYAANLQRLIDDDLLRHRLRDNAFNRLNTFSREYIIKQWNTLFESLYRNN